jgi:uncharacterized protein DUF4304
LPATGHDVLVTAQEAFTKMLKQEVAPALRRLGFKGSGQRYELPSDTHWAIIGFQKFTWSDQERVEFTLNITVAGKDEWAHAREKRPYLSAKPSANTRGGVGWEQRISDLMSENEERRRAVTADRPTEPVAGEVVGAIRDFAIPAIRKRIGRAQARTS